MHEVATDELSGAGSGHGDRSSPSNDVTGQPGMPCADSTSRVRERLLGCIFRKEWDWHVALTVRILPFYVYVPPVI